VLSTAKITYPPKAIESEKKSEPAKKKNSWLIDKNRHAAPLD
jgi:hypothetical protein